MEKPLTGTKLDAAMARLVEETQSYVGKEAVNAAIAAIPYVGASILSVTGDIATNRFRERIVEMLTIMRDQIASCGEEKLEKGYFRSEEFQTLLFLAWEQLRTTHDKKKIRMLGTALSNSGKTDFKSEGRKEFMLRIIRDMSPLEVQALQDMMPKYPHGSRRVKEPNDETQPLLARLAAFGLVAEDFESKPMPSLPRMGPNITESDISRFIEDALKRVPYRVYEITEVGISFVRFLTEEAEEPTTKQSDTR